MGTVNHQLPAWHVIAVPSNQEGTRRHHEDVFTGVHQDWQTIVKRYQASLLPGHLMPYLYSGVLASHRLVLD